MINKNDYDLDDPKDARRFLEDIRIGPQGARIKYLQDDKGDQIKIKDASDSQVFQVIKDIFGTEN